MSPRRRRVCARGRHRALLRGPSTSPLGRRVLLRCVTSCVLLWAVPGYGICLGVDDLRRDTHQIEFLIGGLPKRRSLLGGRPR